MYRRKQVAIPAVAVIAVTAVGRTTGAASASTVNPYKSVTTHQRHARLV
jgi:hypothetical protein